MFESTAGNFADVELHLVYVASLGVVGLNQHDLSRLSEQRTTILPLRWVVVWTVEVTRPFEVTIHLGKLNSESVAVIRPEPFRLCIPVLEHDSVVVLRMVNNLHLRIEVDRPSILGVLRFESV